jgi:aconitate hydratase
MALRSNIPEISKHTFHHIDKTFADRALKAGGGFIVAAENYGQGSSREHAALAPRYLGIKAVIARSFARIHLANLINFGIAPLTFIGKQDYGALSQGDILHLETKSLARSIRVKNATKKTEIKLRLELSERDKELLRAGGKLAAIRNKQMTH